MMWTTFEGRILMWTNSAILFEGVYWEGCMWLPKSQVIIEHEDMLSDAKVVKLKDWLANKKGLLEFTHYSAEELEAMNSI